MIPLFTADEQPTMAEFNERITQANADVQAAIQEAISQAPKIIIGSYTGNGASSRLIDLGAKPDAVLVVSRGGIMGVNGEPFNYSYVKNASGGLATQSYSAVTPSGGEATAVTVISITGNGFNVYNARGGTADNTSNTNDSGEIYNYVAFFQGCAT